MTLPGTSPPLQTSPNVPEFLTVALVAVTFVAIVRLSVLRYRHWRHYRAAAGHDGPSPASLTNCPECGARTPEAGDECEYCGEPLDDEASVGWD